MNTRDFMRRTWGQRGLGLIREQCYYFVYYNNMLGPVQETILFLPVCGDLENLLISLNLNAFK